MREQLTIKGQLAIGRIGMAERKILSRVGATFCVKG